KSQRKIDHIADHDALTGLPNRRALERYLTRLLETPPSPTSGAVFLLDLDGFKRVNDTFGHSGGDELLCEVAGRLRQSLDVGSRRAGPRLRGERYLARFTGDEFVVVDPEVEGRADAARLANRILADIAGGFDLRGHQVT